MKSMKTKVLAALAAVCVAGTLSWGAGIFQTYPIIGGAAYCASSIGVGPAQTGITGQGAGVAGAGVVTGTTICGQTVPAGPPALTGTEVFPVDLYTPGTAQQVGGPATADLPVTAIGQGYGTMQVFTTTGTTALVTVANGVSSFVYAGAGAATFTNMTLPPNPMQNQVFCISDAGTGILTFTNAIAVGTTGQSIVGTTVTSIPVATAVGTAGTVTLARNCWQYQVSNTTWYRTL